jgi:hypothetical protein
MLTPYQRELIHREIDGANTPEESAEVRTLVETQPEALSLMTSLQDLNGLFSEVPDRDAPRRLKDLLHETVSFNSELHAQQTTQSFTSWAAQQWKGVTNLMEEFMLTKKVLIVATTAVAVIAIIGQAVVGYTPSVFDAGTVGAGSGMSGVQQAGRYKGHILTEKDITLSNPEIGALFQNDQILKLVKSEVFQNAMRDNQFRDIQANQAFVQLFASDAYQSLQASDAFHQLEASDAYRKISASDAFHDIMANDAFQAIMANDSYQQVLASDVYQRLQANDAYRLLLASDAFQSLLANDAYRAVFASDAYQQIMANDSYRLLLASDAFRAVFASDAYQQIMANDAYRLLLASDVFRTVSQNASLSDAFLAEANRVQ